MKSKNLNLENNQYNNYIDSNAENKNSSIKNISHTIKNNKIKIYNSFNIIEIIFTQFFKCFMTNSMTIKNDVNEKANSILYQKLDIRTYIRNMILFDIINQTILDENKKEIVNFLCRPVICYDKKNKNDFINFYKRYKETDFNNFSEKIKQLLSQEKKEDREKRIISISNEHLKAFV